ncbi:MAG: ribonuclease HI family protein [Candidatus Omnitrophica bacterium]|nr:ribonuclease HI family protein [Candidatus Omnitrophota bacterium]
MKRIRSCEILIDGASRGNPGPAGIGAVCYDGNGEPAWQLSQFLGPTTNNVAEYLALVYALQEALKRGQTSVVVKTDSELLARQLSGQYRVKDPWLKILHDLVRHLREGFEHCAVQHVPREHNRQADRLAGAAADRVH